MHSVDNKLELKKKEDEAEEEDIVYAKHGFNVISY